MAKIKSDGKRGKKKVKKLSYRVTKVSLPKSKHLGEGINWTILEIKSPQYGYWGLFL